jgi:hypothetical protein
MKCEDAPQSLLGAIRLCVLSGIKILSYRHETDKPPVIILDRNPVAMINRNTRVEITATEDRGDFMGLTYHGVYIIWKK